MNVRLIAHTPDPDHVAGMAAAMCTNSDNPQKSLSVAIASGHESVLEHASFTFLIEDVSRVLLAQLTRHRIASFSVQSQRYCGANLDTVIPVSMCDVNLMDEIVGVKKAVRTLHEKAKSLGKPDEDIRYFVLQSGKTRLMMTMNGRELRHFLALRECNKAQWEIRELAKRVHRLCAWALPGKESV